MARSAQRGSDAARPEKRARLAAADPSVNLVTEQHDGFSAGYGTRHGPGREGEGVVREGVQANDIAAELNQHASVVLAGRDAGGDGGEGAAGAPVADVEARSRSALEDLRRPEVRRVLAACLLVSTYLPASFLRACCWQPRDDNSLRTFN